MTSELVFPSVPDWFFTWGGWEIREEECQNPSPQLETQSLSVPSRPESREEKPGVPTQNPRLLHIRRVKPLVRLQLPLQTLAQPGLGLLDGEAWGYPTGVCPNPQSARHPPPSAISYFLFLFAIPSGRCTEKQVSAMPGGRG